MFKNHLLEHFLFTITANTSSHTRDIYHDNVLQLHQQAAYRIIHVSFHHLFTSRLESIPISIQLTGIHPCIMLGLGVEYGSCSHRTSLEIHQHIALGCLPHKVHATRNNLSIAMQTERTLVISLDCSTMLRCKIVRQVFQA